MTQNVGMHNVILYYGTMATKTWEFCFQKYTLGIIMHTLPTSFNTYHSDCGFRAFLVNSSPPFFSLNLSICLYLVLKFQKRESRFLVWNQQNLTISGVTFWEIMLFLGELSHISFLHFFFLKVLLLRCRKCGMLLKMRN